MKVFWGIYFILFNMTAAVAAVCPHEDISSKISDTSSLEIYAENKFGLNVLSIENLEKLQNIYVSLSNFFPKIKNLKISVSLITAEGFKKSYPELNMARWGFSVILNKFCDKKIIFLRVDEKILNSNDGIINLPPTVYYNFTHELMHVFRFETDPNNFQKNFWAEEGLADHAAYKLSDNRLPPTVFIVSYLTTPYPIPLFGHRGDYADEKLGRAHYGQSFLFFDFLSRRLVANVKIDDIYTMIDPSIERLSQYFNTSDYASANAHSNNVFLGLNDPVYYGNSLPESMFMEFVMKLLAPNYHPFYDRALIKEKYHPATETNLPGGYSFANIQMNNFGNDSYNPTLTINNIKVYANSATLPEDVVNTKVQAFVLLKRFKGKPVSIYTYETFFRYLAKYRGEVREATLVLFNLSENNVTYSFQE